MESVAHTSPESLTRLMSESEGLLNSLRELIALPYNASNDSFKRISEILLGLQSQAQSYSHLVLAACVGDVLNLLLEAEKDPSMLELFSDQAALVSSVIYELCNFYVFLGDEDADYLRGRVSYRIELLVKAWGQKIEASASSQATAAGDDSWGLFEEVNADPQIEAKEPEGDWGMSCSLEEGEERVAPVSKKAVEVKTEALAPRQPIKQQVPVAKTESVEPEDEQNGLDLATHYLVCMLGTQQYALPIHQVREVLVRRKEKILPQKKPGIIGLVTVRGLVCPVIDVSSTLYAKYDESKLVNEKRRCMVVCEVDQRTFCFHVDEVKQVAAVIEFGDKIRPLAGDSLAQKAISHVAHFQEKSVLLVKMGEVIPL